MRVQLVRMQGSGAESWTLLDDDHIPVEPVERFLACLCSIERSLNTVKAYAHDLKSLVHVCADEDSPGNAAKGRLYRQPPPGRRGRDRDL